MDDQTVHRPPVVQRWLEALSIPPIPQGVDLATELMLVAKRPEIPLIPESVLLAWHRHLAGLRRVSDQSEQEFITQARRAGWSWDRVAVALALPSASAAQDRPQVLADRMMRTHPRADPRPWTGA